MRYAVFNIVNYTITIYIIHFRITTSSSSESMAKNTTVKKGDSTILSCGYKDALDTHTEAHWNVTVSGAWKKLSATDQVR